MKNERGNAGLPSGFLNKLNDAGVVIESREIDNEMQYLLTREELLFDEVNKTITVSGCVGIGIALPIYTPKSEVARILTHAIPKMQYARFEGDKMYTMFTYKQV